ncbi:NUDIX hydrolase [Candidatus Uabimicrobium amorphum]|uniref:Putative Nudix hydrolase n=1 Tax=Uabimicrobium amorphum TaxID=2596890 RepID=A0A5S9ILZ3_UABAM|nr:NUDIX domain-containing protein [Candidatus Uabimicrobium amorphum]BBM83967.1 putative Nudix hydrolase [Candidatus Uabimicrobium amorphum]
MEYLYLVDKDDRVLGEISRDEAHKKELLHRAGVVFVENEKAQVFLTERSHKKKFFPGCLDSACSFHVQYGHTYEQAAVIELYEETQITTCISFLGKFLLDESPDRMIVAVFRAISPQIPVLDLQEASYGKYYTLNEADSAIESQLTTSWLPHAWQIYRNFVPSK